VSRTNNTTPYTRWNIDEYYVWWGYETEPYRITNKTYHRVCGPWVGRWETSQAGTELWDLRFYAGCKREPQVIHRVLMLKATYGSRIFAGPGIAAEYARHRRNRVRTEEREYNDAVRALWNAGEDVDDLLEPADSRHGAILWDIW
jgi:hypothetical protein